MLNFTEKLRNLISRSKHSTPFSSTSFDFIKARKAILKELYISMQSRNIIGVYAPAMGEGMFLVAVEDIETHQKVEIIVFHKYDMSGHILSRNRVSIDEIKMICPFGMEYTHPLLGGEKAGASNFFENTVASAQHF